MSDEKAAIDKLYDHESSPSTRPAEKSKPVSPNQAKSDDEMARKFYGEKLSHPEEGTYGTQFKDDNHRLQQKTLVSDAYIKTLNAEATAFASELKLTPLEANVIHKDFINNQLSPVDEESIKKLDELTKEALAAEFGSEKASAIISRAQAALKNSAYLKRGRITSPESLMAIYRKFAHVPLQRKK